MRFEIKVKASAQKNEVSRQENGTLVVSVTVPPTKGQANEKLIELLAEYFRKPKRNVRIVRGRGAKNKIVDVI